MRTQLLAVLALTATAGVSMAQESRGTYEPLNETVVVSSDAEDVRRDAARATKGLKGVELAMATVADVDLNGDGHISFDELLRFDITKDF